MQGNLGFCSSCWLHVFIVSAFIFVCFCSFSCRQLFACFFLSSIFPLDNNFIVLYHQHVQTIKVLNLIRLFCGWVFPYISLTYCLHRWVPPFYVTIFLINSIKATVFYSHGARVCLSFNAWPRGQSTVLPNWPQFSQSIPQEILMVLLMRHRIHICNLHFPVFMWLFFT